MTDEPIVVYTSNTREHDPRGGEGGMCVWSDLLGAYVEISHVYSPDRK